MAERKIYDKEGQAHYLTFSCYKRRRLLENDAHKRVMISILSSELIKQKGECLGFVIMPDHVHAVVRFSELDRLAGFVKIWKQRTSRQIKNRMQSRATHTLPFDPKDPVWQRKYYDFNLYSDHKLREKLSYMHNNPVRAGLVEKPEDWLYSSARWWLLGKSVGVKIGPAS